jgi:hypothetical protein
MALCHSSLRLYRSLGYRRVLFDLIVNREPLISGLECLEMAVARMLYSYRLYGTDLSVIGVYSLTSLWIESH